MDETGPQGNHDARREGKWTLRGQLIGLLLVFTVGPLLLTNAWGYRQSRHYAEQSSLIDTSHVAALEATAVFRLVHEEYQLVSALVAGNQHLFGLIRALATTDDQARESVRAAIRTHLLAKGREGHAIDELYVVDAQGRLVTSSNSDAPPSDQSRARCFRRGTQLAAIDGIDWSGDTPHLLMSAPITDTSDTFLGVLCARMHVELRLGTEPEQPRSDSDTQIYLVDSRARVIATEAAAPVALPGDSLPAPLSSWPYGTEPWEGRRGTAGGPVLASYAPITELGWGILVQTPRRAALGKFDTLLWQAVGFVLILTSLVVLAVIVVARRISRPVAALSEAARRAAGGALGVQVSPGGTVEVRDLAHSFNQMIAAVKDSHDLLEQRIDERTRALRASQELSERLLDSIDQPVVVISPDLTVIRANQAALRRYGRDIVDRSYDEHFASRFRSPSACPVRATLRTGAPATAEQTERGEQGEDIVSVQTFPVVSRAGQAEAVIQLRRVVTDERKLQAQMVHQEKMSAFGVMAAGVAHEVGNPLAAIQSQLSLAREDPQARGAQTLDIVSREVERIARLLREMVQFARRRDDPPVLVALDQVSRDVVRLIQHDPRARDVSIEVAAVDGVAAVRAEEDALVQVLLNLGLNALDAMPEGGVLRFEAGTGDGRAFVRVRDTGGGMSERARDHIFEPFFTTKDAGRGTGLGLFVSKGIVERLGGELRLEQTGSEGTTFCVDLPLARGWQS